MSNLFQNVPVFGKLFGKVLGSGNEVGEKKKGDSKESPSFPDYMLDPDAVVSLVISQIGPRVSERRLTLLVDSLRTKSSGGTAAPQTTG